METDSLTAAQPVELHCEYFENPLGIDATSPRFSWKMRDNRRGARQTAYHLIAADSAAGLDDDNPKLWDTGKVKSSQSLHIPWEGPALKSGQRVYWKVQLSDADGNPTAWSQPAWFEMGLLESSDWLGKWIGSSVLGGPRTVPPAPFLRKEFSLPKPVRTARLYATALGLYEFHLNGSRVGDFVFSPGRTEYKKRVQYNVFDVTDQLRQGDNAMGAILGDGWYSGHVHVDPRQYYGDRPRLLAQLRVDYTDGSSQTFSTDESWKTAVGPILANDILQGEAYDARLEMPGWNEPRFNDAEWLPVKTFADPGITINALRCPPVRRIQEISPKGVAVKLKRAWIFDMGQNMVGRVRLKFTGKRGQTLTVRHAEMLDNQGRLYTEALRSARATDYYTLKGEGEETFEPRFTFHGFPLRRSHRLTDQ
jgi:alpha-L-rhamnosidase